MASDQNRDPRDPGSDDEEFENRLGDAPENRSDDETGFAKPDHVMLPIEDWDKMKKQNKDILKELKAFRKEQKRSAKSFASGSGDKRTKKRSDSEASAELPTKKKKIENDVIDIDPDLQLEQLLAQNDTDSEDQDEDDVSSENNVDSVGCLSDIEQDYESPNDVGSEVHAKYAKLLRTMAKGKMAPEKLKAKQEKHKRPANCDLLVVPRVNPEIWSVMDNTARAMDLKIQRIQKNILTATLAMIKVGNTCFTSTKKEMKTKLRDECLFDTSDAIGVNLKTIHDLSMERRTKILSAPNINQKYRKLASEEVEISDQLFGNDLRSVLSSIESSSKLGISMTQSTRGRKFLPNFPKNGAWGEKYRGRGRPNWPNQAGTNPFPRGPRGRGHRGRGRWMQRAFQSSQ